MLEIVLLCVAAYGVISGFMFLFAKGRIWNYQQRRQRGIRPRHANHPTPEWERTMNIIGLGSLLVGAILLAVVLFG
jgi:hypothetical protein